MYRGLEEALNSIRISRIKCQNQLTHVNRMVSTRRVGMGRRLRRRSSEAQILSWIFVTPCRVVTVLGRVRSTEDSMGGEEARNRMMLAHIYIRTYKTDLQSE